MTDFRRDAVFAVLCGAVFLAILRATGSTAALLDPVAVAIGVTVAIAIEAAFVFDTPAIALWERRWIRWVSVLVLVVGVAVVAARTGPLVVAAACWGLLTYFAMLGLAIAGYWPVRGARADG